MASSTSRHVSYSRGRLALLFTGIVGAPILWLAALQAGYTLSYQACDERSTRWVSVPTFAAFALAAAIAAVCAIVQRRAAADQLPMPLLAGLAVGVAVLMVVVLAASAIAPLM